jgi:hypothetical protein
MFPRPSAERRSVGRRENVDIRLASLQLPLIVGFLGCIDLTTELSRVAVPGTEMVVVLSEDEKRLYRYQPFNEGVPITSEELLGGHHSSQPPPIQRVATAADIVTIEWLTDSYRIQVVINPAEHRVVRGDVLLRDPPVKGEQASPE